jgi:hypothetical protein
MLGYVDAALGSTDDVHVVFTQTSRSGVAPATGPFLTTSRDEGATWSTPTSVSRDSGGRAAETRLLLDEYGTLHVIWRQSLLNTSSRVALRSQSSSDEGVHWHNEGTVLAEANGVFDVGYSAAIDDCGALVLAYPHGKGVRIARFGLGWPAYDDMLARYNPHDISLASDRYGSLSLRWSAYRPSSPSDSIVQLVPMESRLFVHSRDRAGR